MSIKFDQANVTATLSKATYERLESYRKRLRPALFRSQVLTAAVQEYLERHDTNNGKTYAEVDMTSERERS